MYKGLRGLPFSQLHTNLYFILVTLESSSCFSFNFFSSVTNVPVIATAPSLLSVLVSSKTSSLPFAPYYTLHIISLYQGLHSPIIMQLLEFICFFLQSVFDGSLIIFRRSYMVRWVFRYVVPPYFS